MHIYPGIGQSWGCKVDRWFQVGYLCFSWFAYSVRWFFISVTWSNLVGQCGSLADRSSDDLLWSSDDSAFAMESETIHFFLVHQTIVVEPKVNVQHELDFQVPITNTTRSI